jgi:hypothetical protein
VKLLFTFYKSEEFDYTSYYKCYAMSILLIGDIESCGAALYFARQEWEVYLPGGHEIRCKSIWNVADKRLKLFELIVHKRRPSKPHRIIRLWASTVERFGVILAFIDTFI